MNSNHSLVQGNPYTKPRIIYGLLSWIDIATGDLLRNVNLEKTLRWDGLETLLISR